MTDQPYPVGLRLAAIVLLLLAWLPAFPLGFFLGPWAGVLAGLPSAACFVLAHRRTGAPGNLLGAAAALATPLVWRGLFVLLVGDASLD